jgi:hypothetical protein
VTLGWILQYCHCQRHSMINHCDRHITHPSDTDISFGLFNLFTYRYFDMPYWVIISKWNFEDIFNNNITKDMFKSCHVSYCTVLPLASEKLIGSANLIDFSLQLFLKFTIFLCSGPLLLMKSKMYTRLRL